MPRFSRTIKTDTGFVHVDGTYSRARCSVCKAPNAGYQCDYPTTEGKTCDAWLCEHCRKPQGPNVDYCPKHAAIADSEKQKAETENAIRRLNEMIDQCNKQLALAGPQASVVYVFHRKPGTGEYARLWGRAGGPVGRIVAATVDSITVMFHANEVRASAKRKLRQLEG